MTLKGSINPAADSVLSIPGWLKIRKSMQSFACDIAHLQIDLRALLCWHERDCTSESDLIKVVSCTLCLWSTLT